MSSTLYPNFDMKVHALKQKLARADARIAELEAALELAQIGARRYETARRMNVQQWKAAFDMDLRGLKPFDQIIDELRPFYFPARAGGGESGDGG